MANTSTATAQLRQSKRKRTTVSYHEPESDDEYGSDEEEEGYTPIKKARRGSKTLSNQTKLKKKDIFPFLSLPAELRIKIYQMALVPPEGLAFSAAIHKYRRTVTRVLLRERKEWRAEDQGKYQIDTTPEAKSEMTRMSPAILAVNKQINAEALPVLYTQDMNFQDTVALHQFLAETRSAQKMLQKVVVHAWGTGRGAHKAMNHAAMTMLAGATNLKSLCLNCTVSPYSRGYQKDKEIKLGARQLFRDGHFWFEAMASATGRRDAGIDVVDLSEENFHQLTRSGGTDEWEKSNAQLELRKNVFRDELRRLLK